MARKELGYVRQGEIKFIAAEDEAAEEALTSQEDATEPTAQPEETASPDET